MHISIDVEGVKQLSAVFEKTGRGLSNLREPLQNSTRYMEAEIQNNYDNQGATFNAKWAPLAESTKKQKLRKYGSTTPLVNTGRMKKGFKSRVGTQQAVIENNTPYFKYHQSNKPRTKLPRRVMMAIGNKQQAKIIRFFTEYLNKISK